MIPPIKATREVALHAEKLAHQGGWDQPPMLLELRAFALPGAVAVEAHQVPIPMSDGNPAVYLRVMADHMGEGHMLAEMTEMMATPNFCGLAYVSEAWGRHYANDEQGRLEREARTQRLADMPGSVEVRSVIMVDTAGRLTSCSRIRGQKPQVNVAGGDNEGLAVGGGRVPAALRDMVLAIALRMPSGTADLDALRGIKLEAERG